MPRPSTTSVEAILNAATQVAAERGPAAATVQAISIETGAPVGSLYHRFASRESLLAQAWLRAANTFITAFVSILNECETIKDGVEAALVTPRWARANRHAAALILSHRREEFLSAPGAADQLGKAEKLARVLSESVGAFVTRIDGAESPGLARSRYALIGVGDGAVRMYLPHRVPPPEVDLWVQAAYLGVMSGQDLPPGAVSARSTLV